LTKAKPREGDNYGITRGVLPGVRLDLMVGEKKAISRGIFGYNGPYGSLGGHCAVQKSMNYILVT
jgi:hypothetical protein